MKVSRAATIWIDYHSAHSKKIPSGLTNPSLGNSARILEMSSLDSFLPMSCCHF